MRGPVLSLGLVWLLGWTAGAAPAVAEGERTPFGFTNLWTIDLVLSRSDWAAMTPEQPEGPVEPPRSGPVGPGRGGMPRPGPGGWDFPWSVAIFKAGELTFTNVGIRFKGNSSFRMSQQGWKRPLKLDFNRGAKGRTWLGTEEVYLNNNLNDATQFREVLAYDAYRRAGLPAPRTAFARVHLTITGEQDRLYAGLYTVVEAVEADFLKAHFGTKKGLLLKPERLRTLEYLGDDWNRYPERYEPKTDVKRADADRFIALTRLIEEADDATLARELPERLDLEWFLRYLAVTAWLANYDSFIGNGHNYYLFQPSDGGRATFIPWDLNEAFGGHPMAGPRRGQAEFSILQPGAASNRLIERVLANPDWARAYRKVVEEVVREVGDPDRLIARAAALAAVVREAVSEESAGAGAAFRWVALGDSEARPTPPAGTERRPGPEAGPGLDPWRGEDGTLAEWIRLRARLVDEELAGKRTAMSPRVGLPMGRPGRPGGPPWREGSRP